MSHQATFRTFLILCVLTSYLFLASHTTTADQTSPRYSPNNESAIGLAQANVTWHTFLGGPSDDKIAAVATDSLDRVVVIGTSAEGWGEPLNPHQGGNDIFVAQFSRGGNLNWLTFLGGLGNDSGVDILVGAEDIIYLVGNSDTAWGEPLNPHNGQQEIVLARLSPGGKLVWNSFYGSAGDDVANDMALQEERLILIAGNSDSEWGEPINPHQGNLDAVVIRTSTEGADKWHTFIGSESDDSGEALAADSAGQYYLGGTSNSGWGDNPVQAHTDSRDGFVAQLTAEGELGWHTFLGTDQGGDIVSSVAVDDGDNVYLTGASWDSWGEPLNPFAGTGYFDAFVAKFNRDGQRDWLTFMGSESQAADADAGYDLLVDRNRVYVVGDSREGWGTPLDPFVGERDGFISRLDRNTGVPVWQSFLGGPTIDYVNKVAINSTGDIFVVGYSWGTPLAEFNADSLENDQSDGFVVRYAACLPNCADSSSPAQASNSVENDDSASETDNANDATDDEESEEQPSPAVTAIADTVAPTPTPFQPIQTETTEADFQGSLDLARIPRIQLKQNDTVRLPLTEIGLSNKTIRSPYGVAEYSFQLPDGWILREESALRVDLSYFYSQAAGEGATPPEFYGNLIIAIDGQMQAVQPLAQAVLANDRFRVPLPIDLLNSSERETHTLSFTLDTNANCTIPHEGQLTINAANTLLILNYDEEPLAVDLAQYPRPFDRQAFTDGEVLLVLPENPTSAELRAAVAIAARLGNIANYRVSVESVTDQTLINRLAQGDVSDEHLVIIGQPERNKLLSQLNQWQTLPTPFRERQLGLTSEGPALVAPDSEVTYRLKAVNPTEDKLESLQLTHHLPPQTTLVGCNPLCTESEDGLRASWFISSLAASQMSDFSITLQLSEGLPEGHTLKNRTVLQDATTTPLNVSVLTSRVGTFGDSEETVTTLTDDAPLGKYFMAEQGWTAGEGDGVVQGMVAPWNARQAILIVSGLTDEAITKAGRAMGARQRLPGLVGTTGLIDHVTDQLTVAAPANVSAPLGALGYQDQLLQGHAGEVNYSFEVPAGWRLMGSSQFELSFNHSQLIDFTRSYLRILLNENPVGERLLTGETASQGSLDVYIPPSQIKPGANNELAVQVRMESGDNCAANDNNWLVVNSQSRLRLDFEPQGQLFEPTFDTFPRPFSDAPNLSQLIFSLPAQPTLFEWQQAIRVAAMIGQQATGGFLTPQVAVGDQWQTMGYTQSHIIAIGRPTRNPIFQDETLNNHLPQPFAPATDQLQQTVDGVALRLLPGVDLGVLELVRSPWQDEFSILAISGTTDEGVQTAGDTLYTSLQELSNSSLAFISGENINKINVGQYTRDGLREQLGFTSEREQPPNEPTIAPTGRPPASPTWLIPMIGATAILVIAVLAIAYWQSQRQQSDADYLA